MACAKAGAMWGGFFKRFKDYPHNELPLKVSWRYIGKVYYDNGLDKAIDEIKKNLEGGNYG